MNRSVAAALAISLLAVACAKDKGSNPAPSAPADTLSSQNQCAMLNCQRPPGAKNPVASSTATSTGTSTANSTNTSVNAQPPAEPPPVVVTPPVQPQPDPHQDQVELNDTQKMAKNASLTCNHGDCDPSVGLLSIVLKDNDKWNAGQCTASLVAPDVLVTNGHCIPPDLVAPGSDCRNRMWITFAPDSAHREYDKQLDCRQVLFRRKDGGMDGADYAYLKLTRASNRPVLRQDQSGFADAKAYHLHKINPARVQGGIGGMLQKVDCTTMYNTAIFSAPLDARSQTMMFVDCEVIPGNSGSPILADDGSVHGVIYAFVKKPDVRNLLDKNGAILPQIADIADLNVGSNFACLNLPGDNEGRALPPACANQLQNLAQKRATYNAVRVRTLRPTAQKLLAANAKGHADIAAFGWTLTLNDTGGTAGPFGEGVPECVNKVAAAPFVGKDAPLSRPLFPIRASYDKYLRATAMMPLWGGFEQRPESMRLSLGGSDFYALDVTDPDNGQNEFNSNLSLCSGANAPSPMEAAMRITRPLAGPPASSMSPGYLGH